MMGEKREGHFRIIDEEQCVRWFKVKHRPGSTPEWVIIDVKLKEGEYVTFADASSERELTDRMWERLQIWY